MYKYINQKSHFTFYLKKKRFLWKTIANYPTQRFAERVPSRMALNAEQQGFYLFIRGNISVEFTSVSGLVLSVNLRCCNILGEGIPGDTLPLIMSLATFGDARSPFAIWLSECRLQVGTRMWSKSLSVCHLTEVLLLFPERVGLFWKLCNSERRLSRYCLSSPVSQYVTTSPFPCNHTVQFNVNVHLQFIYNASVLLGFSFQLLCNCLRWSTRDHRGHM